MTPNPTQMLWNGNGFYEYAIGSSLEKKLQYHKSKQHFEEAFGLLIPFRTKLAQTAMRLLVLKMNCSAVQLAVLLHGFFLKCGRLCF
jgi:hypothetical protein